MIGPPFLKLSMRKFPLTAVVGAAAAPVVGAAAAGDGARLPLNVAVTLAPGAAGPAGDIPTAGAGDMPTAGGGAAGLAAVTGAFGGAGGGAAG